MKDLRDDPELAERLVVPGYRAKPERGLILRLGAFGWNRPQHITPPRALEDENAALRARLEAARGSAD